MHRLGTVCVASALALLMAGPAHAAEGTVSPEQRVVEWSGTIAGPTVGIDIVYGETGSTHGTCVEPACDSYVLEVSGEGASPLIVHAEAAGPANNVTLEVELPDGQTAFQGGTATSVSNVREITIPSAPDGRYVVRVTGETTRASAFVMDYAAFAKLGELDASDCRVTRAHAYEPGGTPLSGAITDDPLYGVAHGHAQMDVPAAWARGGRGQGVTIAVLDTGLDLSHPEFAGRIAPGADLTEGQEGDCGPGPMDVHGHGTHVAGLAAAGAGNGIGIAGVAPEASIMPVKVCNPNGGCPGEKIADGIRWAADHGAGVINLSLGTDELASGNPTGDLGGLADAVAYATGRGAVVVAAAGNSAWPLCAHPAADPGALCVASVDRHGLPARYSNLPFDRDAEIDGLRAFGGSDVGTDACGDWAMSSVWPGAAGTRCGKAYGAMMGTSMASPHVAGAAAVLLSLGLPGSQVPTRLLATASNRGAYDPVMGFGIPDLDRATAGMSPAVSPPPAPDARRPSAACRRARAALRAAIRRATRARNRGARRTLRRELRRRDAAQRQVRRRCR